MPNFNSLKTTSDTYFPKDAGRPCWKLDVLWNVWDLLIDYFAAIWRTVNPADQTVVTEAIAPGPSPFTYTAGSDAEQVHISGGIVSAVERWSESEEAWVVITQSLPVSAHLPPGGQLRITYTSAPLMVLDYGNFSNAAGVTEEVTPGASPWTYTAGGRAEELYFSGGAVASITRNGVSLTSMMPCRVTLPRGGAIVVTYTAAPYVVRDT